MPLDEGEKEPVRAFTAHRPDEQSVPLVFASPHSGRDYSPSFIASSRLSAHELRRSEDAYVDQLFESALQCGAPFLQAMFPRAYVDANRTPFELDPAMFSSPLPDYVTTRSPRIDAGLGTVPKIVAENIAIYDQPLNFEDIKRRIEETHIVYHKQLARLIDETCIRFGGCLLIDCHSMPSSALKGPPTYTYKRVPDVILGDGNGITLNTELMAYVVDLFKTNGFRVAQNKPYAGGYTTLNYADPLKGVNTLQIEINRGLYLNERKVQPHAGMGEMQTRLTNVIQGLCRISPQRLIPDVNSSHHNPKAAE